VRPNVIYLYDFVCTKQALYLFLEYCPGGSLGDVISKHGTFAGKQLYGICKEVLVGLCYTHSMRWAHLDIKPANIFIDKNGRAKLADFGISQMFENTDGASLRAGTLAFAAPELFQRRVYDPFKADICSFALTSYFMTFGSFPYPAPGKRRPSFAFSEIPFPADTDPIFIDALRAMLDEAERSTAAECLNLPLFASADVKNGWMDDHLQCKCRRHAGAAARTTKTLSAGVVLLHSWYQRVIFHSGLTRLSWLRSPDR
jgi:serine/threonine protein kinase